MTPTAPSSGRVILASEPATNLEIAVKQAVVPVVILTAAGALAAIRWQSHSLFFLTGGLGFGFAFLALYASMRAKSVLHDLDYLVCPICRYRLHGLGDHGRCPECGEPFEHERLKHIWAVRYDERGAEEDLSRGRTDRH